MAANRKATMKDIAIIAGVTTQTVSRALSGSNNVHPETKKKVIEIANSLNYIKNSSASILRSGSSKIIAVFYDNLKNIFFSLMSDYLYNSFKEYGYTIMTIPLFNQKLNMEMYKYALSLNVAGIISFLDTDDELSEYLQKNKFPLIIFGRKSSTNSVDYIALDDEKGGLLAAEELMKLNGKRYLYIGETMSLGCSVDRYRGFKEELAKHNLRTDIVDVSKESISNKLDDLKRINQLPDSIFCFNDMLACTAIYYFEKNNLPKPNIIGFDALSTDIPLPCELKSIGIDKEKIAKLATTNLVSKIENTSTKDVSIIMPVKLYK